MFLIVGLGNPGKSMRIQDIILVLKLLIILQKSIILK